jgi:hypothetical protein
MRRIHGRLTKEISDRCNPKDVPAAQPYFVPTYRELVEHIARLAYLNGDHLLFFRGQGRDFLNRASKSTFYPTVYRDDNLAQRELDHRFDLLASAVDCLKKEVERDKSIEGGYLVRRKRYIQWIGASALSGLQYPSTGFYAVNTRRLLICIARLSIGPCLCLCVRSTLFDKSHIVELGT